MKKLFENVGGNQFKLVSNSERPKQILDENNILVHQTRINEVCKMKIPDPLHGDFKLSVFPFKNVREGIVLPHGFKMWESSLNEIMKRVPLQKGADLHYVTIDSRFFTKADFLRRHSCRW